MAEAYDKGNALELAVRAIEIAILCASPSYNEKTFRIDSKRKILVDGVHHEIDIWVSVDLGDGYTAIFIFECKNWQEKVGKNEIIIFTEKIRSAQAQKGFFVARSFTSDAEAQAEKEPRIQLVHVSDLQIKDVPVPLGFHGITTEILNARVAMRVENTNEIATSSSVDLTAASFTIDEQPLDLNSYINDWIKEESNARTNRFRSEIVSEGFHSLSFEATRKFSDKRAIVNGKRMLQMDLDGEVRAQVTSATVVSHFDVETRGRVVHVMLDMKEVIVNAVFAVPTARK